jgi:putative two-component system response regulator
MSALAPFADSGRPVRIAGDDSAAIGPRPTASALIVDDDPRARRLHRTVLESLGANCTEAEDGASAVAAAATVSFDLVLLDLLLPDLDGYELCQRLRESAADPHQKVLVVSGAADQEELCEALSRGADDYLAKPLGPGQLSARARHALRLKQAQDRALQLADELRESNRQLQVSLDARGADVRRAHDALLFTMAKMAESQDGETAGHLRRIQCYTRMLAREAAAAWPAWAGMIDDRFLADLERCAPLHDIGKIGLPDRVLLKPTALDPAERLLVEMHPLIGDRILEALGREHGASLEFLGMARAIVRHHHERWDGCGYPDGLCGDAIPAAARLVAVADVYDAIRRQRQYKSAMGHTAAMETLLASNGQFDPMLVNALARCEKEWERTYRDVCD